MLQHCLQYQNLSDEELVAGMRKYFHTKCTDLKDFIVYILF